MIKNLHCVHVSKTGPQISLYLSIQPSLLFIINSTAVYIILFYVQYQARYILSCLSSHFSLIITYLWKRINTKQKKYQQDENTTAYSNINIKYTINLLTTKIWQFRSKDKNFIFCQHGYCLYNAFNDGANLKKEKIALQYAQNRKLSKDKHGVKYLRCESCEIFKRHLKLTFTPQYLIMFEKVDISRKCKFSCNCWCFVQ